MTSSNQDIKTNVATLVCRRGVRGSYFIVRRVSLSTPALEKIMPSSRCVVQGCSNLSNPKAGISLHNSPVNPSLRAQWKRFVSAHRANFNLAGRFVICSEHFTEDCFARMIHVGGAMKRLQPSSVPTIWRKKDKEPSTSSRDRRMFQKHMKSCILLSPRQTWRKLLERRRQLSKQVVWRDTTL